MKVLIWIIRVLGMCVLATVSFASEGNVDEMIAREAVAEAELAQLAAEEAAADAELALLAAESEPEAAAEPGVGWFESGDSYVLSDLSPGGLLGKGFVRRDSQRVSRPKVTVVPSRELTFGQLAATMEDLHVMCHFLNKSIRDERIKGPRRREGLIADFGKKYGRDSIVKQAAYVEKYGAMFMIETNVPMAPLPQTLEKMHGKGPDGRKEPAERVYSAWERTRLEMFPSGRSDAQLAIKSSGGGPEVQFAALIKKLIKSLRHATNIRSLKADEWVILTVTGIGPDLLESIAQHGATVASATREESAWMKKEMDDLAEGEPVPRWAVLPKVLTIRVKKADADVFVHEEYADEKIDLKKFREKVQLFLY